jgi:hypothetical protein
MPKLAAVVADAAAADPVAVAAEAGAARTVDVRAQQQQPTHLPASAAPPRPPPAVLPLPVAQR